MQSLCRRIFIFPVQAQLLMSFESKTSCKSTSPSIYYAIRINTIKDANLCKFCMTLRNGTYATVFSCFPCPSAKLPSLCRLDLEAGTFLTPLEMQKLTEINEVVTILALRPFSKALLRSLPFAFCHGSEGQYLYVPSASWRLGTHDCQSWPVVEMVA